MKKLDDSPMARTMLIIFAIPVIMAIIGFFGFRFSGEAHITDVRIHLTELQSHEISRVEEKSVIIEKIDGEVRNNDRRLAVVETQLGSIISEQSLQSGKLDDIKTLLIQMNGN